ncbi:type I restriction-modification system subunit M N-terminal domain-containing protein [Stutzerimonas kunmingensis]|uniref:type I restriction-modification system subunit M N-terminal domain-containing protein n=1 Tax=Stutzerimonas kunmingensis TaxID=1211807 RepID=UPI0032E4B7FF
MFEQAFKNIDDILHKDAGCTSELDYTEQTSWLLFLKYLDALEQESRGGTARGQILPLHPRP